jgi:predicted permease
MSVLGMNLLRLYLPLISWIGLGVLLGRKLPNAVPAGLGQFLFWIGVPLSIIGFLQQAELSATVWMAPLIAWLAIGLGGSCAWLWLHRRSTVPTSQPAQGSFILAAMVGNTGYLGYPIVLALVGPKFFAWAVLYDTLGSTLGSYGLGAALAAHWGSRSLNNRQFLLAVIKNPALWSFWIGLGLRSINLPLAIEQLLRGCAWMMVAFALLLLGMRLSQISSGQRFQQAAVSLSIKMLIVPLLLGLALPYLGISGAPQLVLVLQMAMPPAFATLVLAEAYDLDRELTVTTLAMGSLLLLLLLPVWLWLFAI